jgi:epoxyqueuosine reductase QueG
LSNTGNRSTYVVDGSKCISYFTIELKENIPQEMKGKFDDWALVVMFVRMFALE